MKHKNLILLALLPVVSGCNAVTKNVVRANDTAQDAFYNTGERMLEWTDPAGLRASADPSPQTGFCYRFPSDIVCYEAPQPGLNAPLLGYQGYVASAQARAEAALPPENAIIVGGSNRMMVSEIRPVRRVPTPAIAAGDFPLNAPRANAYSAAPMMPVAVQTQQDSAMMKQVVSGSAASHTKMTGKSMSKTLITDPEPLMPRY